MNLKPLGDRVLIKPAEAPTTTESGLHLAEHLKPEQTGTVVAVGVARHPLKQEADALAKRKDVPEDAQRLLQDLVRREPLVQVGDAVLFSWQAGQELRIEDDGERYLLMREGDILAVIHE